MCARVLVGKQWLPLVDTAEVDVYRYRNAVTWKWEDCTAEGHCVTIDRAVVYHFGPDTVVSSLPAATLHTNTNMTEQAPHGHLSHTLARVPLDEIQ